MKQDFDIIIILKKFVDETEKRSTQLHGTFQFFVPLDPAEVQAGLLETVIEADGIDLSLYIEEYWNFLLEVKMTKIKLARSTLWKQSFATICHQLSFYFRKKEYNTFLINFEIIEFWQAQSSMLETRFYEIETWRLCVHSRTWTKSNNVVEKEQISKFQESFNSQ